MYFGFSMIFVWRKILLDSTKTYSVYRSTRNLFLTNIRLSESFNLQSTTESGIPYDVKSTDEPMRNISVLDEAPILEDTSYLGPALDQRSFNFAAFANHCLVLQKLVDLGVSFYKIEQKVPKPHYLLKLNFETDVQPYIKYEYLLISSNDNLWSLL